MATKKKAVKKGVSTAVEATAAAAVAAVGAAAAGYYFYGTKNAKKHRQAASKWAQGLKKDVVKSAKSLKKLDAKTLARVVDDAAAMYQGARGVAKTDVRTAASELKKNWKMIERELAPSATVKKTVAKGVKQVSKSVKTVSKAVSKSAPKKTVKKTAKKR